MQIRDFSGIGIQKFTVENGGWQAGREALAVLNRALPPNSLVRIAVSPNCKIPANSFQSLDFRVSRSNDKIMVL